MSVRLPGDYDGEIEVLNRRYNELERKIKSLENIISRIINNERCDLK